MKSATRYNNDDFGRRGEAWVYAELKRRGYPVKLYGGVLGFDGLIGKRVTYDVKTAALRYDKSRQGYSCQFNLSRYNRECVEHLVIGLCYAAHDDKAPIAIFIIPGNLVKGQRKISITSKNPCEYAGKYARYRGGWGLIDEMLRTLGDFVDGLEEIPF